MYTVSSLSLKISETIQDSFPEDLVVKGAITDVTQKHDKAFFTVHDDYASLSCYWENPDTPIQDGDTVRIEGSVTTYAPQSTYQITVETVTLHGESAFKKQFRRVKQRLRKDNVITKDTLSVPTMPERVGVVTSKDGAAIHDIHRVLKETPPETTLVLAHATVQGSRSPTSVKEALNRLPEDIDCVIIARGGGSSTDLIGFNDESLARAIAQVKKPVITGIGHESDTTIADLVADEASATPTQAAQRVVVGKGRIQRLLDTRRRAAQKAIKQRLNRCKKSLRRCQREVRQAMMSAVTKKRRRLQQLRKTVTAKNPRAVLEQEYYPVYKEGERVAAEDLSPEDSITIRSATTTVKAEVTWISKNE